MFMYSYSIFCSTHSDPVSFASYTGWCRFPSKPLDMLVKKLGPSWICAVSNAAYFLSKPSLARVTVVQQAVYEISSVAKTMNC
jgi:hypothetical protein